MAGKLPGGWAYSMQTVSKTFRLSSNTAAALEQLVKAGRARSQAALIEELIEREKRRLDMELQEEALDAAWQKAMTSKAYRTEMQRVHSEFKIADAESLRHIR